MERRRQQGERVSRRARHGGFFSRIDFKILSSVIPSVRLVVFYFMLILLFAEKTRCVEHSVSRQELIIIP